MSAARRKGKWIGGSPLLGYDLDPHGTRLLVNESEAVQVRGIFDLYLETESLLETARELNRRGWTAKRWVTRASRERGGKPFTKGTLFALLTNATYTGQVDFRGTVYPGEHAGIVDEAVWQRVQRLLQRNGRAGGQAVRNKHGALLSGLLRCGPCDAAMTHTYSQKGERRYRYYVCGHAQRDGWETCPTKSIPAQEIERFVVDRIRAIGTDPKLTAELLAKVRAEAQGSPPENGSAGRRSWSSTCGRSRTRRRSSAGYAAPRCSTSTSGGELSRPACAPRPAVPGHSDACR